MKNEESVKIIIDQDKLLEITRKISPLSTKLFLYMTCKHPDGGPFRMTHAHMIMECDIAAPARCISELAREKVITRRRVGRNENEYQINEEYRIIQTEMWEEIREESFNKGWAARAQWNGR